MDLKTDLLFKKKNKTKNQPQQQTTEQEQIITKLFIIIKSFHSYWKQSLDCVSEEVNGTWKTTISTWPWDIFEEKSADSSREAHSW